LVNELLFKTKLEKEEKILRSDLMEKSIKGMFIK
jgi:hypothetical protein